MNADLESVTFARHHHDLWHVWRNIAETVAVSLAALHRHDFDAPWKLSARSPGRR